MRGAAQSTPHLVQKLQLFKGTGGGYEEGSYKELSDRDCPSSRGISHVCIFTKQSLIYIPFKDTIRSNNNREYTRKAS